MTWKKNLALYKHLMEPDDLAEVLADYLDTGEVKEVAKGLLKRKRIQMIMIESLLY